MLSLLEAKRLIRRTPHPRDGRARSVRLTLCGGRLAEKMRRGSRNIRAEMAALFNEQEMRLLIEFLERLAGAMRPPGRAARKSQSRAQKQLAR
jgi:DNA-binding MarR family transcriptional regulator